MVDRTETIIAIVTKYRYVTFEVTMSTSDTVTLPQFTTIQGVALFALNDGLEDTATISGNVVTLTQSGETDQAYVGIAVGT